VVGFSTGPCSVMGCGAPVMPVLGLAFAGLSSTTIAWMSQLSSAATMLVFATMVGSVVYLSWRMGTLAAPARSAMVELKRWPRLAPPDRQAERSFEAGIGQRFASGVATDDGVIADRDQHVAHLKTRLLGHAPTQDDRDRRRVRRHRRAAQLALSLTVAEREAELRGHPIAEDVARHRGQADLELLTAVETQDGELRVGIHRRGGEQALEQPRPGPRPLAEGDDDVAGLQAGALRRRALEHFDDHDAEALTDPVTTGDLFHLLLGQIADAHPEPRKRMGIHDAQQQRGQHDGGQRPRDHVSSSTRASSAALTRSRRRSTASVSSSS